MSLQGKQLTTLERAVLYLHIFEGCNDWKTLYKLAENRPKGAKEVKSIDTYVSKWKHSIKVTNFVQSVRERYHLDPTPNNQKQNENKSQEKQKMEGESKHTETKQQRQNNGFIDYSDPKNRLVLYNDIIAKSEDDPKTQLDTAKLFEQIQKDDREALKAQRQTRVYLPLRCENCPLYQNEATK